MKASYTAFISCTLLIAASLLSGAQTLEIGSQLPELRGETLADTALVLPRAASGKIAFLTITFSSEAGKRARVWNERFSKDHSSNADTTSYSIAMLEGAPRIFRGMIKRGIKKGVPQQAQDRFLIVTRDEAAWKKYLNVSDDDLPYLLLIDANGRVVWKDQGTFEEQKYEALKAKLAKQAK